MRAVEELLDGSNSDQLSTWLDKKAPKAYDASALISLACVRGGMASRDGLAWKTSVLKTGERHFAFHSAWKVSMETGLLADEAAERATTAIQKLDQVARDFRANTKNDITSMKAASERVQTEVVRMGDKYKQAMTLLNSEEFKTAVEQAERMAKAFECISALSETKLSVAVFSGGKHDQTTK